MVVHPNLLKQLNAWDDLENHMRCRGTIGSRGAITATEIDLLGNCGFTISKKEPDPEPESDFHPNGCLIMTKWKKEMDAILEDDKNTEPQTINEYPNLIKCRKIIDEFIVEHCKKEPDSDKQSKKILSDLVTIASEIKKELEEPVFEITTQPDTKSEQIVQEDSKEELSHIIKQTYVYYVFDKKGNHYLVEAETPEKASKSAAIDLGIEGEINVIIAPKCDICKEYLLPAPARSDGELTYVGFAPCIHKNND